MSFQQVFFVADDQFGVFEAHVLNDINRKLHITRTCIWDLLFFHLCSDIGEWFESSIGSDFQSKALTVINQASSLLSSKIHISHHSTFFTTDKHFFI